MMVNLSGTERWRELCRLLGINDGGLDYGTPEGLAKLSDREWNRAKLDEIDRGLCRQDGGRVGVGSGPAPAAVAKCNSLAEWLASEQAQVNGYLTETDDPALGQVSLMGPPLRITAEAGEPRARTPARRGAGRAGRAPHRRPLELLGRPAGLAPPGRTRRGRREGGAARRRGRVPDDAGPAQHLRGRQPLQARARPRSEGRGRPGPSPATSWRASDVVVENAMAGVWERLGLDEAALRAVNPTWSTPGRRGSGWTGRWPAARLSTTSCRRRRDGDGAGRGARPRPGNVVVNDYGTGFCWRPGWCCALLGRARGVAVTTVDASLGHDGVAVSGGRRGDVGGRRTVGDQVGDEARGPAEGRRLYRTKDGWVTVYCVTRWPAGATRAAAGGPDGSRRQSPRRCSTT